MLFQKHLLTFWLGGVVWVMAAGVTWAQSDRSLKPGVDFGFVEAARVPGATAAHSATVLADGDVLVVGGHGELFGKIPIASTLARVYEPQNQKWRVLKGSLNHGRLGHAALRLPDGKVLIVGGRGQNKEPLRSVELFDPADEQFKVLGNMAQGRLRPCLNLLADSKVLITGENKQAEIIEPSQPSKTGYLIRPTRGKTRYNHSDHTAITLADGSVLLIGGRCAYLEQFENKNETFFVCEAQLPKIIDDQAAILLYDGKVLLAGGQEIITNISVGQSWIYDPKSDRISEGPFLKSAGAPAGQTGAADMQAVDLFGDDPKLSGRYILLAGGEYDFGIADQPDEVLRTAWVYNAVEKRLIDVGPMLKAHDDFAATPLPGAANLGQALIIGGYGPGDTFQSECEIFYYWIK